ncbi:MAG: hypothetical protein WBC44_08705 [Planctomycetaceae bacterium]
MMRAALLAAAAMLLIGSVAAEAQVVKRRSTVRQPDGRTQTIESRTTLRPIHDGHGPHHGQYGHGHYGHDFGHGHGYSPGYGYNYGYGGVGVYGSGLNYYRGPATFGGITPPVYVYPPYGMGYGYGGLGYSGGFGPTYGYGTAWAPAVQTPLYNPLQQYRYDNDWSRLSAELADRAMRNVEDPRPGTGAVPVPSTPEAKIKSARFEAMGDEAFANQEYAKALGHFKTATGIAKDNGAAFFKTGYAYVALGRFPSATESFKRGLAVDPVVAATGPTPDELYGDHQLAWTSHLGRVTRWVAEDVRDAQRVFLLGTLLLLDGDTRAREFLEKAWQLSGGTESAVVTLLSPPKIENVQPAGQAVAAPAADAPAADAPAADAPVADAPVADAPAADAPVADDVEVARPGGPDLGPVPDDQTPAADDLDLPKIPEPPSTAPSLPPRARSSERPYGQEPLFPLPSEQNDAAGEPAPPLPAE